MKDFLTGSMRMALGTLLTTSLAAVPAWALEGKWVAGDFHQHSYITDGSNPTVKVLQQGFDFGLDWQANSEHGGTSDQDGYGTLWKNVLPSVTRLGSPLPSGDNNLWRWQTLADNDKVPSYLNIVRAANPEKIVVNGMEMNMPGAEHCSTAIIDPTGYDIARFEYLWDKNDSDRSGGYGFEDPANNGVSKNTTNNLIKATQAAAWMQTNFARKGWMIPAHPERAADKNWTDGITIGYDPNFFRTLNDAGPDVFFAFESAPGHQKDSGRGGYDEGRAYGDGTYGGVGHFASTVGGLWDALLGEGREFWLVANSDFHSTGGDFWPGEYQKTYSYMTDANGNGEYDGEDVVASMRSGNMFIVHGDLIDELDFRVFHGAANNKKAKGRNNAAMGQTLRVEKGDKITVRVRFKSPAVNNCQAGVNASSGYDCKAPSVKFVQLIAGEMTGRLTPGSIEYTSQGTNPTARVVATFDPNHWTETADGYTECSFELRNVEKDMYFRVRGTNLAPNTPFETDRDGNPLFDNLVHAGLGIDGADEAWADLWFYSNPVFVKVAK